jgi:PhoPQ-activated pathogenicity-related protein
MDVAVRYAGRAMSSPQLVRVLLACSLVVAASSATIARRPARTALDRYVATLDPAYRYSLVETKRDGSNTISILEMTSQSWMTSAEVNRTEWTHWVTIIRPATVRHQAALVFVTGGDNDGKLPQRTSSMLLDMAETTQSVVAEVRMVPNQPLVFAGDGKAREEDEIIAFTWDKFLRSGDARWPLRLPMTKAVVRALDTVTDFCAKPEPGALDVDRFVVSGASKRGWTTWTTAAVDARVIAIAPLVIDALNIEPSFVHHWRTYGFWAPAVKDYEDMGIMRWMRSPQNRALLEIEDPYEYRDRLTMPKYMVNSTGDQFFLPDSWKFYFEALRGEKYLRYVPNTDHALKDSDAPAGLGAFYSAMLTQTPRPQFTWRADRSGRIRVETKTTPVSVALWQATNPKSRDFRLESIGPAFRSTPLAPSGPGLYEAQLTKPATGWTAGLIELRFDSGTKYPCSFTTGVAVVPDVEPFPEPPRETLPAAAWVRR